MNLLAAIRNVHIKDVPEPESMTDYWRTRPVAESDCNCKKCTGGSNPYGDESCDSYQRTSLAELMELAWKEHEDTLWRQTQKVWRQYEEAKRPPAVIEENPEVTVKTRAIRIRHTEWEINDIRKEARAMRRRNTKRRQRRRLELLKAKAINTTDIRVDVEVTSKVGNASTTTPYFVMVPLHLLLLGVQANVAKQLAKKLKQDISSIGTLSIVRMTPHKLKGKPWQASHMPAKDLGYDHDYTAEQKQRSVELRHHTVCAAHDQA